MSQSAKPLKHLIPHYTMLGLLFLTGGLAVLTLDEGTFRWTVLGGLVGLYIIWGIWHHYEEGSLTHQVALEYVGIAALLGTILLLASQ